jgi:hypothetical protein
MRKSPNEAEWLIDHIGVYRRFGALVRTEPVYSRRVEAEV